MKITEDQIKEKTVAGTSGSGEPVIYILSKGGLHCFLTKDEEGKLFALAAAPHKYVAKFFAQEKDPNINWQDEFLGKSEMYENEDLDKYKQTRELFFSRNVLLKNSINSDKFFVYHMKTKTFELMSKSEVIEGIKEKRLGKYDAIRPANLSDIDKTLITSDFKEFFE